MIDCEIVHKYLLAEQEGKDKKLSCFCTSKSFFVKSVGRPVGEPNLFESGDVDDLLNWVRGGNDCKTQMVRLLHASLFVDSHHAA